MINHLFSTPLWRTNLSLSPELKEDLITQINSNYSQFVDYKQPKWNCNVHSTMIEHNHINYERFSDVIVDQYTQFSTQMGLYQHTYKLDGPWYNYYVSGSNQELHTHCDSGAMYSGVYFLKLNPDHPRIAFYNTSGSFYYYEGQKQLQQLYQSTNILHSDTQQMYELDVVQDDFIIFPAYLSHAVFVQNSAEPRITISFNINTDKQR